MLNLKFAEAYVDLSLRTNQYDSESKRILRDLARFPGQVTINVALNAAKFRKDMIGVRAELYKVRNFQVNISVNRTGAAAAMNLVRQQAAAMQRRSFGTIPIRANLRPWRAAMKTVAFDLYRVRQFAKIPIGTSGMSGAHANINLLIQQLKTAAKLGRIKVSASGGGRGIGGFGGGMGGFGFGGQFASGLGQGLGLPYASSPGMLAGNLVGSGISGSVGTAASLQTQIAELRRVSGMSAAQAQAHKQSLFDVGTSQAGVSVNDLMEISNIGGRAGVADREGPEGLLTFTKDLALVKNAVADMPTEELAGSMMKVLNVFELGTDRVAGFGSALTAMDNVSVASARDILNITTRLSGTAQAIGLTLPQITAFSSVLKDVGLSNEVAGSSFSQIFRKMATDSENFAKQIGMDARDFADAYRRDPMEALGLVIKRFGEMKDTIEGQEFLSNLGLKGVRTAGSLQQLASKFEEVEKRAKLASDETGNLNSLMAANALKSDTLEASYAKLKNALVELADAMGTPLLEPATAWTKAMTGLVKGATHGQGGMLVQSAGIGLSNVLSTLNPVLGAMTGGTKKSLQDSFNEAMFQMLHGNDANGKPIGAAPALPAKKPQFVGPPRPGPDPFAAENLIFRGQQKLGAVLGAVMDTRQALFGAGARTLGVAASTLVPEKKKDQMFSSSLTGDEVGRHLQDSILNMAKDRSGEETAANTKPLAGLLGEMRDLLKAGANNIGAAVLGQ